MWRKQRPRGEPEIAAMQRPRGEPEIAAMQQPEENLRLRRCSSQGKKTGAVSDDGINIENG
ncbi:MAG: hypothetical protein LUD16_01375 [Lachnospiraceae bacterium]|nr:hypothetical protein [Lachnospiraceae bacterium]